MKGIIRALFINSLILYLAYLIFPGIVYDGSLQTLAISGITLTILNRFVKPLLKLLLLPINLITLGVFRWFINVFTLFILTAIVAGYHVGTYQFSGFVYNGFIAPPIFFNQFFSFVIASSIISLLTNSLRWLL
ncbi:hypothetical protein A2368_02815 [Candidatus Collierbacteria bacterium RIFOXYB1_FULL_49_13]|uniref:Phage holin family protein n=1 Tax=Candidatus Collierbacteria bacterium RIFOXYB1_FULL_49_13 TaxID=1817728 RepID=A0A1F5FFR8_9BACT|nr:MAG: hypothetical protein A2368_02815 [Candidatus Collierbacteria bacterium RIFOXYB1_FULL_49_13]